MFHKDAPGKRQTAKGKRRKGQITPSIMMRKHTRAAKEVREVRNQNQNQETGVASPEREGGSVRHVGVWRNGN